jgi:hypothetical protein
MATAVESKINAPIVGVETSPDIFEVVDRVDQWRCGHDVLYRLFTGDNNNELYSFVSGLIGGGENKEAPGLLRARYGSNLDANARNMLTYLRQGIDNAIKNEADRGSKETRIACHFLVLISLVLEHEFLNYVVLSVHNRDALRSYITQFLTPALAGFLQGVITKPVYPSVVCAFDLVSFVDNCRTHYIIRCKPCLVPHAMPNPRTQ